MIPYEAVAAANKSLGMSPNGLTTPEIVRLVLEAAAPHMLADIVATVDGLDALAGGTVILSDEGGVFEAIEAWNRDESEYGIQWMETGTSWRLESHEVALPATILYRTTK